MSRFPKFRFGVSKEMVSSRNGGRLASGAWHGSCRRLWNGQRLNSRLNDKEPHRGQPERLKGENSLTSESYHSDESKTMLQAGLVYLKGNRTVTTSRTVADRFGKVNKTIIRAINNLECSDEFRQRNFVLTTYSDCQGKPRPMFEITRAGFSFLAMGFTGKKAAAWKEKYIEAFDMMEQALLNQQNLSWQQARIEGKSARRELTDTVAQFVEYASNQGSSSARLYYLNITRMTYKALFMVKAASPKPFRDMLDVMQSTFLASAEYVTQQALTDGMVQQLPYKNIYQLARDRVTAYAGTLPLHRFITA